jgi:hypothetical protein
MNNSVWKPAHISKVYEALTAIADGRVEMGESGAKVYSSSRGKHYDVTYYSATDSIASNDNTAYFTGAMSYPMIAYFMLSGRISYDKSVAEMLKGIPWKDINQRHKNDYDAAIGEVLESMKKSGVKTEKITTETARIYDDIVSLKIRKLNSKKRPPKAY